MIMSSCRTYLNFIDGGWSGTEEDTFEVKNPADMEETIGFFQRSNEEDLNEAVKAAAASKMTWAETPGPERGRLLRKTGECMKGRKEELAESLTREEGKTLSEARGEVQRAIDIFYYYAEKARDLGGSISSPSGKKKRLYTKKEPVGVVGLITPWNYPIAIPSWKLAPALAAGNTVVIKPASLAPNVCRMLIECMEEAGFPDGVVNFVTGPGSVVGEAVAAHEDIDAVSFTGSRKVGERVYERASKGGKRVQTEMGGKNPVLVMKSADIERAVEIAADGSFGVTGQACTATSRAIVHEELYDDFVEKMKAKAESIEIGPGIEDPDMGPQVSEEELEATLDYIDAGKKEGAKLVTGGEPVEREDLSNGHFIEPTLFSEVEPEMRIAQEEIFGPVLAVIRAEGYEEAVDIANDVDYGLSASILTEDLSEAHRFIEDSEAGVVKVNEKTTGLELHIPFGGFKASSSETWREQGDAGLDFYTISKTVYLNY
ncbi:MAG: aldehyde dehydrogenase family protein [Candidatus Aenigmatarchaeota archaeon]